MVLMTK